MARNLSKNTTPRDDTAALRGLLRKAMPAVLQKLYNMALDGDVQAAKLLLDRTIPVLSPTRDKPTLKSVTMLERIQEVKAKVLNGEISGEEAHDLVLLVNRLEELEKLAQQLEGTRQKTDNEKKDDVIKIIRAALLGEGQ